MVLLLLLLLLVYVYWSKGIVKVVLVCAMLLVYEQHHHCSCMGLAKGVPQVLITMQCVALGPVTAMQPQRC